MHDWFQEDRLQILCRKMLSRQETVDRLPEELEFFDPPTVQSTIESSFNMDILPLNQVVNNSEVIEFIIPATEHYLDLTEVFLYVKCQIAHTDPTVKLGLVQGAPKASERTARGLDLEVPKVTVADDAALDRRVRDLNDPNPNVPQNIVTSFVRDAAPVNGLFYMMFDRCEIEINGTPFTIGFNNYGIQRIL